MWPCHYWTHKPSNRKPDLMFIFFLERSLPHYNHMNELGFGWHDVQGEMHQQSKKRRA